MEDTPTTRRTPTLKRRAEEETSARKPEEKKNKTTPVAAPATASKVTRRAVQTRKTMATEGGRVPENGEARKQMEGWIK